MPNGQHGRASSNSKTMTLQFLGRWNPRISLLFLGNPNHHVLVELLQVLHVAVQKAQLLWHWISSTWQKIGCDSKISPKPLFPSWEHHDLNRERRERKSSSKILPPQMAMDQYLLIPFLVGWTSIYQLFWCSPGVQGFDTLPNQKNWLSGALMGMFQLGHLPGVDHRIRYAGAQGQATV